MFNEKYKNENEKINASEELIGKTRAKMKAAITDEGAPKRHFAFIRAASFATIAAVVCLCVFGNILPDFNNSVTSPVQTTKSDNFFILTAYAMEQEADGTIVPRELEFSQSDSGGTGEIMVTVRDDKEENYNVSVYSRLGFKSEGTNISKVVFSVDEGEFAGFDGDNQFTSLGKTYMIDFKNTAKKDDMIYWGYNVQMDSSMGRPTTMLVPVAHIKAVVTFEDGEVQEKTIVYDTQKGTLLLSEK